MPINLFDANFYRVANSDLSSLSDEQALSHFQNYGLDEGRAFSAFVDLNFYRASSLDITGLNNRQAYNHLQDYGLAEGRRFSPFVNLNFYRESNSDFTGFNNEQAFEHLQNFGISEGRRFSPFVDLNLYRAANPDLSASGWNNSKLFDHLVSSGAAEGRRFSIAFDSNYYRNVNLDLAGIEFNNRQLLEHFELNGLSEGRASSESFNVNYYLANNSDLKALGFNNQQAEQHFEIRGFGEGRLGAPSSQSSISADPGNTFNSPFSLDVLNGSRTISQYIGSADKDDYYRFTLASNSNFNLSLSDLINGTTSVKILVDNNGNGEVDSPDDYVYTAFGTYNEKASISSLLGAGTYFIQVSAFSGSTNTNYTLQLSATSASPSIIPKEPDNTLATAFNIGTLNDVSVSFREFVGSTDRDDYYRFSLTSTRNFNLNLDTFNSNRSLFIQLIQDRNGNSKLDTGEGLDYTATSSLNESASISKSLKVGTYLIKVNAFYPTTNTDYNLRLFA